MLAGWPGGFRAPGCSAGYPLGVKLIEFGCLPPLVAPRRSWWVLAGGGWGVDRVLMHASGGMDLNARLGDFKAGRQRYAWAGLLGEAGRPGSEAVQMHGLVGWVVGRPRLDSVLMHALPDICGMPVFKGKRRRGACAGRLVSWPAEVE